MLVLLPDYTEEGGLPSIKLAVYSQWSVSSETSHCKFDAWKAPPSM